MYSETKLTFTFKTATAAIEAKKIASETLLTMKQIFSFRNAAETAATNLIAENNILLLPREKGCFLAEECMEFLPIVLKAIAEQMPNEDFTFEVTSTNDYSDAEFDGKYSNGTLCITSTYYPEGYCGEVACHECGEYIVRFDEYDSSKTYICPHCGEEVDLTEKYNNSAPVITKETVAIK